MQESETGEAEVAGGQSFLHQEICLLCGPSVSRFGDHGCGEGTAPELENGEDRTDEVTTEELQLPQNLSFSSNIEDLSACNFIIITVPTPVDNAKQPNLNPLISASSAVASILKKGDIVVYESTVFPGCTEEICVPELEKSGLIYNQDFYCGYSPERINPGDKKHRLVNIRKVTSGSTPEIARIVDKYYKGFIEAGTFIASSIRVAEAAKVIENSQRDINIAFVNELSLIFNRMNLDTLEVLEAAGTKWNFLPFKPGLVGGHCIGVDPYYLTYKAEQIGYRPEVILAGRRINDGMGSYVATETVKMLIKKNLWKENPRILILGFTFKENCPDTRNTRVVDIFEELRDYNVKVDVYDPNANEAEVKDEYGINLIPDFDPSHYQAAIVAVSHDNFKSLDWPSIHEKIEVIYDIKGFLPKDSVTSRL